MTADPLPESWKAGLIWQAQRREGEGLIMQFSKREFDFILQVFGKERARAPGILYINFPLYEKISTKKDYSKIRYRILEELRWKFGGKCRTWFWLNIMRYWGKGLPEHLHVLNSGRQSALTLLIHPREGKTLNEKTRRMKCINLIGEFKTVLSRTSSNTGQKINKTSLFIVVGYFNIAKKPCNKLSQQTCY